MLLHNWSFWSLNRWVQIYLAILFFFQQMERGHHDNSWLTGQSKWSAFGQLLRYFHRSTPTTITLTWIFHCQPLINLKVNVLSFLWNRSDIVLKPHISVRSCNCKNHLSTWRKLAEQQLRVCGRDVQPWPTLKENGRLKQRWGPKFL